MLETRWELAGVEIVAAGMSDHHTKGDHPTKEY